MENDLKSSLRDRTSQKFSPNIPKSSYMKVPSAFYFLLLDYHSHLAVTEN